MVQRWQRITLNIRIALYLRRLLRESSYANNRIEALKLQRLKRIIDDFHEPYELSRDTPSSTYSNPGDLKKMEKRRLGMLTAEAGTGERAATAIVQSLSRACKQ